MEFFTESPLDDLVLVASMIAFLVVKVKFVVSCIDFPLIVGVHVDRYWQNARQTEVRIFDILTINFLIPVKQVGILKLFNWLLCDFGNPEIVTQSTVF
jgi:hypothetical protein